MRRPLHLLSDCEFEFYSPRLELIFFQAMAPSLSGAQKRVRHTVCIFIGPTRMIVPQTLTPLNRATPALFVPVALWCEFSNAYKSLIKKSKSDNHLSFTFVIAACYFAHPTRDRWPTFLWRQTILAHFLWPLKLEL